MVNDAIDEGGGRAGGGEDGAPVAEGQVAGDDRTASLVAAADDLVEQVGVVGVVADVAELVEQQEAQVGSVAEASLELARLLGGVEIEQEVGGGDHADGVAGHERLIGDVLRQRSLAQAVRAYEHHVVRALQEVQRHQ